MISRLSLRQTGGFLRSLASLLGLGLPIPDHTTLSRRLASDLTSRRTADCARVPELLDQIDDRVATFMAYGAFEP